MSETLVTEIYSGIIMKGIPPIGYGVGGGWHGWLFWRHPDGQWVSLCKVPVADTSDVKTDDRIAALEAELAEASLNGDAIMEARAYLVEHLGKECEQPFFDDCIHNAVAITLKAKEKLAAKDAEIAALKADLEERGRGEHVWEETCRKLDAANAEIARLTQRCEEARPSVRTASVYAITSTERERARGWLEGNP